MVLDRLRQLADEATYEEVVAGMVGLAQWDERRRGLDKPIWLMLRDRGEVDVDMEHMFYKHGFRVGKREGKKEGKALWLGKGIEQGIEQGRLAAMKDNLKKVLQKRGFVLSSEQETQIDICSDVAVLDRWFEKALVARSLSAVFGQGTAARRMRATG